jgi:hypothetical protein
LKREKGYISFLKNLILGHENKQRSRKIAESMTANSSAIAIFAPTRN